MTTHMPSLRIDVSLEEWPKPCGSPSEDQIQELRERLSTTPTKDPSEIAQALATRTARTAMLHKLEVEAKLARAKRVNDLVQENRARKLRMEAAAVARASSKIEKATKVESARRQEHEAKREAAAARRNALFEAVRAAREDRQMAREARQAELAKLEQNATSLREKKLQSTVGKSSAQVKHALEVAASLKEKEKETTAVAAARLAERLSAASSRRQDVLAATVEGASSVVQAAEKVRLRHLYSEKAAIEERRVRLAKAMDKALGRREAKIEKITSRAAVENARVADVVADARLSVNTVKPATMRHTIVVKQQAASVRRLESLKKKPLGTRNGTTRNGTSHESTPTSSPNVSLTSSPNVSQAASQAASPIKSAPAAPWSTTLTPTRLFKPEPVIVIDTEPFHFAAPPPSSRLLSRLQFRPRMLLTTAAARHVAASGRRQTRLSLIKARASHLNTVRAACVRGRRAAADEFSRAFYDLRERKGAARAKAALRSKVKIAARFNERVNAVKIRLSNLRLRVLNAAITKEEKRLIAGSKRAAKLDILKEGRWDEVKAYAVKVRRAAAREALLSRCAEHQKRSLSATSRRETTLAAIVSRAQRASMKRETSAKPVDTKPEDVIIAAEALTRAAIADALASVLEPKTEAVAAPKLAVPTSKLPVAELDARITELKDLLQKRLQAAAASTDLAADEGIVKQRMEYIRKAAEVSNAGAAQAAARAEAKLKAKAEAKVVKTALKKAAVMAGLHGREAREAAATGSAKQPSVASSVASSDTEDWQIVPEKA